ncbi:DUF6768 family protein [Parvularcula sp. LCG005]|uniref:DUF6768 family protein n=1 Tax=Parvularcula sp. LCG005 TaxID=3078805 RepID=UPI0029436AED|nr:DUF6768 family protein [Parvularcula sp. LCG005]WOI53368.1 DUF6768 family protein [Parvularcula sp. LCG005]
MSNEDATLRRLSAADQEFLDDLEDGRGLFTQLGATFQGPMRFWTIMIWVMAFVLTGLGFFCVYRLFAADAVRPMILWAFGAWAAWSAQMAVKQWIFQRMGTLTILRELKKLELRLARLEDRQEIRS